MGTSGWVAGEGRRRRTLTPACGRLQADSAATPLTPEVDMRFEIRRRILTGTVVLTTLAQASAPASADSQGVPLCTVTNDQLRPVTAADGAGGVIVAWHDNRPGAPAGGVCYAQRL